MSYFASQVLNGLSLGSVYALTAIGFGVIYGVLRMLNFAHSEVFTSGVFIAYGVLLGLGDWGQAYPVAAILIAIAAAASGCALLSMTMERVAYRPLRGAPPIAVLLSAIGVSIFLQNVGIHAFGAQTRGFPGLTVGIDPRWIAVAALAACFGVLLWTVYASPFGVKLRAVAENPTVAKLMGVRPDYVILGAFALSGAYAGVAGVIWGVVYGTVHPQMGFYLGLKCFIIAVLGGVGSVVGTLLMGLALGLVETLVAAYLPDGHAAIREPIVLSVLLLALVLRPGGISGLIDPRERV